jgi:hypothetical protein
MPLLSPYQRARLLLATAAVVCFFIFWWMSRFFDIPVHPGHEVSLLQQPHAAVAALMTVITWLVCAAIGTAVAGVIRFNAGLVAAGIGLMASSVRGGTSRDVLFHAIATGTGPAIFIKLIVETLLLGLVIGASAMLLEWLYSSGTITDRESALPPAPASESSDLAGFAVQLLVTAVGVALIARTEDKQQVLAAVAVGSFAGTAVARSIYPGDQRGLYWTAPFIVGIVGYLFAYLNPGGMSTGSLTGPLAPLARPLPLDYASLGVAGAVVGHWMGRRWHRDREDAAAARPLPASARTPS